MFSGGTLHSHSYFEQDQYDFLGDEGKESMKRYGSPTERMIASYYGDDDDDEITSFFPSRSTSQGTSISSESSSFPENKVAPGEALNTFIFQPIDFLNKGGALWIESHIEPPPAPCSNDSEHNDTHYQNCNHQEELITKNAKSDGLSTPPSRIRASSELKQKNKPPQQLSNTSVHTMSTTCSGHNLRAHPLPLPQSDIKNDIVNDNGFLQGLLNIIETHKDEIHHWKTEADFLPITQLVEPRLVTCYCSWSQDKEEHSSPPKKKSKTTPLELTSIKKSSYKETATDLDGSIFSKIFSEVFPKILVELKGKNVSILLQKMHANKVEQKLLTPLHDSYRKVYVIASELGKKKYNLRYTKRTPLITGIVQMFIAASIILHSDNILKYPTFIDFEHAYQGMLDQIEGNQSQIQQEKMNLFQDANLKFIIDLILPYKDNKHWIIEDICPRLLSFQKISLGSGKTPPTVRRELIFEREHKAWGVSLEELSKTLDARVKMETCAKHNSKNYATTNLFASLSSVNDLNNDGRALTSSNTSADVSTTSSTSISNPNGDNTSSCTTSMLSTSISPTTIADVEEAFVRNVTGSIRTRSMLSDDSGSVRSSNEWAMDPDADINSEGWSHMDDNTYDVDGNVERDIMYSNFDSMQSSACHDHMITPTDRSLHYVGDILLSSLPMHHDHTVHDKENLSTKGHEFVRTISEGSTCSIISTESNCNYQFEPHDLEFDPLL